MYGWTESAWGSVSQLVARDPLFWLRRSFRGQFNFFFFFNGILEYKYL